MYNFRTDLALVILVIALRNSNTTTSVEKIEVQ